MILIKLISAHEKYAVFEPGDLHVNSIIPFLTNGNLLDCLNT